MSRKKILDWDQSPGQEDSMDLVVEGTKGRKNTTGSHIEGQVNRTRSVFSMLTSLLASKICDTLPRTALSEGDCQNFTLRSAITLMSKQK